MTQRSSVEAGAHVGDGTAAGGGLGVEHGVLLEHVPAAVAAGLEAGDDAGDVEVALAEGAVHALPDRVGVAALAAAHRVGERGVDVLEVGMGDAVAGLGRQLDRVAAADQQVPGVQAQRDAAAFQHAPHLVGALHHGADVGVQGGDHAARRGGRREEVEVGQQGAPLAVVEPHAPVVAVLAADGGQHHGPRTDGRVGVEQRREEGQQLVAGAVVQQQRDEAADRGKGVGAEQAGGPARVVRQEAGGPELAGGEAERAHLAEHPVRAELVAPARHLADAPRDRRAGDAEPARAHQRTSPTWTGRSSARERSAASAT